MGHKNIGISKAGSLITTLAVVMLWTIQPLAGDKDDEIQDTILRQIEAFANGDQEEAWAYASEGVKRRFGSSQVFLDMVREAYPAVHSATAIEFDERVPHKDFEIQVVRLQDPEGQRWDAHYRMVLVEGAWKIAGVQLQEAETGI
ncbi:MAG: DUF4864 domain-containing protein [Oleiphilaceae bacterium]|nr:DUF4864 domain-containing protein [Oleiphilaceae bacterium]